MQAQRAFTLIEMFIVLALLSILGQIAVPALQDFLERNQQQALYEQITRAVYNARLHAVTHRIAVELCGSSDGATCDNKWAHGWLLRESKQTHPVAVTQLNSQHARLHWDGFRPSIRFNSNGISPVGNGRFYSCYKHSIQWQLVLNRQGRLRTTNATENNAQAHRCS